MHIHSSWTQCVVLPKRVVPTHRFWDIFPTMKDAAIVKNTIQALSPRVVAVHGPTGTGKSTVFPLAITHSTEHVEGLTPGLTDYLCAAKTDSCAAIV